MKLLIVIGSLERGGSERQVVELVRASHPRHAEVVVVCLNQPGPLADEVRATGARVVALGYAPRMASRLGAVGKLAAVLRRERPDVVYAFLFVAYSLALPA